MIVSTKAIVLSSIKYNDTSLIVKCFTHSSGVKSYLLKGVLSSKKGKLKKAYFQPLMLLEVEARHKNNRSLENINEAKVLLHFNNLRNNIFKNAICIFLSEILSSSLHEEEANPSLFNYIEYALHWLNENEDIANFHISFLLELTKYLGFYPDDLNNDYPFFDLQEGVFTKIQPSSSYLHGDDLKNFTSLLGTIFDGISSVKMNHAQRYDLLNALILYFELHLQGFKRPKSLQVLSQVFH